MAAIETSRQPSLYIHEAPPRVIAVTNGVSEWKAMSHVGDPSQVAWAIGLHPAERHSRSEIDDYMRLLPSASVIGEVGLDGRSSTKVPLDAQRSLLDEVLDEVEGSPKLITLHTAGAVRHVLDCVQGRDLPGAVLHWFLGDEMSVDAAVALDLYFSINPSMLRSSRGRIAVQFMPPNRVVLETDAPFGLSSKSSPVDIGSALQGVVRGLAKIWNVGIEEAHERVIVNQGRLLSRARLPGWT